MLRAPALAALLIAVTGCATPGPADDDGPAAVPATVVFALGPDGTLTTGSPEAASVRLSWAWRQWLDGTAPPRWQSAPMASTLRVSEGIATVTYQAESAAVSTPVRDPFTVWFGVEDEAVHHAFAPGPPVLAPAAVEEAAFPLRLPAGGLVVPAGARLTLAVGSYYGDDAGLGALSVLLGGEPPLSSLSLTVVPVPDPALVPGATQEITGALEGGRCLGDEATEADMDEHPLDLPAQTRGFRVVLERTGGIGPGDIDMQVANATGDAVVRAQGPGPSEVLTLWPQNLAAGGPGPWTLRVYNCTPQTSEYRAQVTPLQTDAAPKGP